MTGPQEQDVWQSDDSDKVGACCLDVGRVAQMSGLLIVTGCSSRRVSQQRTQQQAWPVTNSLYDKPPQGITAPAPHAHHAALRCEPWRLIPQRGYSTKSLQRKFDCADCLESDVISYHHCVLNALGARAGTFAMDNCGTL
jgi:hypothetical protein